ncbi:hypothetical protein HanXRQr2_Chr04g0182961 [Helianthus annuus]|uniref:Uncharacterized protein n=1 Tax=Helianthus annuus TaxID=4232 RepID=A0A9K3JAC5_HELAN|nr:hypothetical protein HanXRQr2_Chr04g0182961 [Helianthus annuus]
MLPHNTFINRTYSTIWYFDLFLGATFYIPLFTFFTPLLSHIYRWGLRGTDSFPLTRGCNQERGGCV